MMVGYQLIGFGFSRRRHMRRRRKSSLAISANQAQQALAFLVQQGKIAVTDVRKALENRERLVQEIRERLARLGIEVVAFGKRARRGARAGIRAARRRATRRTRKSSKPMSAARRAAMKAQGRYMAAIRRLPKASRAKVKTIRERSGVSAAIAAAKRMHT
jgi:hypothetical protein